MNTRCIAEKITGGRADSFDHLGGERRRSVVVKIDTHGELFIVTFPLSIGKKRTRQAYRAGPILAAPHERSSAGRHPNAPKQHDRRRFTCGNGTNRSARRADSQRRPCPSSRVVAPPTAAPRRRTARPRRRCRPWSAAARGRCSSTVAARRPSARVRAPPGLKWGRCPPSTSAFAMFTRG